MGKRNFSNFLKAYMDYARDGFVPDKFHYWAGISIIAGALERKVWVPWGPKFSYYPNLYIILVSHPGIGKSSAINQALEILRMASLRNKNSVKILPSQVTEAKLIDLMSSPNAFEYDGKKVMHCSGYYYASEASNSLRDIHGAFINTLTDFYDCHSVWEKATISMREKKTLINICLNLIAGSTFDYLGKLITDESIMGGFASRLIYVMQKDMVKRSSDWQSGFRTEAMRREREDLKRMLVEDLQHINKIVGPFRGDEEVAEAWQAWFREHDEYMQGLENEKLQALQVRKSTIIVKLCMVLAAAESDERVIRLKHWKAALDLLNMVEKDLPNMLMESKSKKVETQSGINSAIIKLLCERKDRTMSIKELRTKLMQKGFSDQLIYQTLNAFTQNFGNEDFDIIREGLRALIRFKGDKNDYI